MKQMLTLSRCDTLIMSEREDAILEVGSGQPYDFR